MTEAYGPSQELPAAEPEDPLPPRTVEPPPMVIAYEGGVDLEIDGMGQDDSDG